MRRNALVWFLALFSLFALTSCDSKAPSAKPQAKSPAPTRVTAPVDDPELPEAAGAESPTEPSVTKITMRREACRGTCPDYQVTIDGSGKVQFDGRNHVARFGTHHARVPPTRVADVIRKANEIDFFAMDPDTRRGIAIFSPNPMMLVSVESKPIGSVKGLDRLIRELRPKQLAQLPKPETD